jgi:hypothetical protein
VDVRWRWKDVRRKRTRLMTRKSYANEVVTLFGRVGAIPRLLREAASRMNNITSLRPCYRNAIRISSNFVAKCYRIELAQ